MNKIRLLIVLVLLVALLAFAGGVFAGIAGGAYFVDLQPGQRLDATCWNGQPMTPYNFDGDGYYWVLQCQGAPLSFQGK